MIAQNSGLSVEVLRGLLKAANITVNHETVGVAFIVGKKGDSHD